MTAFWARLNTLLLVLVLGALLAIVGLLADRAHGGPLDPPNPPGSTDAVKLPGTPISSVPFTIDNPGYYYATGNLAALGGNGITINASGVTLDLGGFSLFPTGLFTPGSGITTSNVDITLRDITIRNGVITGWQYGIRTPNFISSTYEDLRVSENNFGISTGSGNTIRRVTSGYNQLYGLLIEQRDDAWGGWVTDSDFRKNGTQGMIIEANNVQVSGNVIGVNGAAGVQVSSHFNEILDNQIIGNGGYGVDLSTSAGNTIVARNRFVGNGAGTVFDGPCLNGSCINKVGPLVGDTGLTTSNPWSNSAY